MTCDFCALPGPACVPTWRYPAASFVLRSCSSVELGQVSLGDWAACEICRGLIEAGDMDGLAQRAAVSLTLEHPEFLDDFEALAGNMRELHAEFFEHRAGAAVPIAA